ncbi:MAG TPA: type I DNA topoisomerase [Candidatus Parcubacteria bacterium]|nr:type I DNA topoisomerase [Candidatus Parcubacteria bacterium]
MKSNLLIVESPTKAKTLSRFLGSGYKVLSSYGHVRDLPKSELGVDIENDFKPKYIVIPKARKNIQLLKKEVEKADLCYLATDPDREGEAIAWHLSHLLGLEDKKKQQRIVFHEITKEAIEKALKSPRKIDMNLVNAQQARRILDRVVGYKLSPFLWKKIARGLSAGRVQSAAVRLIVEREREIEKFIPQEYWKITALLKKLAKEKKEFEALLVKKEGKTIPKLGIKTKKEAEKIVNDLKGAEYQVSKIKKRETNKNPLPPFITSTLQQTAWQRFKWSASYTMSISQQLYEKGYITYHRSDSLHLSDLALATAKKFINSAFGENYYQFRQFKTKSKTAQEAHEAIRPSYPQKTPENLAKNLEKNQLKLYDLIWRRFIASQMKSALFEETTLEISAKKYTFQSQGISLKFDGFSRLYPISFEKKELPSLKEKEKLELLKLIPSQHFTRPPSRYTEASLIKELEKNGIGRPSTYAPIISTIQERNYVEKDENKKFKPTEIGIVVNDLLVGHFPNIVDIGFTAKMEGNLDKIAQGKKEWVLVLKEFYQPFEENLQKKYKEISKKEISQESTEKKCPKCQAPLVIRLGKYGRFYACSSFPKCRYTQPLEENTLKIKCPKCQKGKVLEKRTKKNKVFYGCSRYPKCDFALWDKPLADKTCPKCGSLLVETKRKQIKCSNKECDFLISSLSKDDPLLNPPPPKEGEDYRRGRIN